MVNPEVIPSQSTLPDVNGDEQVVCASRDRDGIVSDFVEGVVLFKPKDDADLQAFLDRYDGEVIDDDTIPVPPEELGITLTDEERAPSKYVVRVNADTADLANLEANASILGLPGRLEFTSQAGMATFACVLDAKVSGFDAGTNDVYQATQALPVGAYGVYFNSQESPTGPMTYTDAFAEPRFGSTGSQSKVALAWQFIFAHGFQRRTRVAIIDGGYWLDSAGRAMGPNSDFIPPPNRPTQYDFIDENAVADGPNIMGCGAGNPCYWHGTGAASVATGELDNRSAYAGTGGLVADPLLFKVSGAKDQRNQAVRTAVAWGADVVSMSFGGDCNLACRIADRDDTPFTDAVNRGSKTVFVAAAGNGRNTPAVGYDVGAPNFFHPCIEDHVLCVGALSDNTTTKIGYSNFGGGVDIFAPTNIPSMGYPSSTDAMGNPLPISQAAGPEQPQPSFGGTSASTPFVAGIAAMMKSLKPELSGAEITQIMIETANPGTAPANLCIDALACVRRAATGVPNISDRFEPNNTDDQARDLGSAAMINHPNLSIDSAELDYFRIQAPNGAAMTINLQHMKGLGDVNVFSIRSLGEQCTQPILLTATDLPNSTGKSFTYRVPGGPLEFAVAATAVNAYNLGITYAPTVFTADFYEANNTVATARRVNTFRFVSGIFSYFALDPRVTVDATLHTATDIDYYIVRGATVNIAEIVFLIASPTLQVYGNDSPMNVQVFRLNADGTQGASVANLNVPSCPTEALTVPLESNLDYLVRVSGTPGQYKLRNGVTGDPRRMPILVRDRIHVILNPGEPIENVIRFPELLVFAADRAYSALRIGVPGVQLRLYDIDNNVVAEGVANGPGKLLDLSNTNTGDVYAIEIMPEETGDEIAIELEWEAADPVDETNNLLANPGAETTFGDPDSDIPSWTITEGEPTIFFYNDEPQGPSLTDEGPDNRGMHLFSGGPATSFSQIQQSVAIDPSLLAAIDAGLVKFRFSAFLGGSLDDSDHTVATVTFQNGMEEALGEVILPTVTPADRDNESGLLPVEASDYVPEGTTNILVTLTFVGGEGDYNDAFADNLELVLSEYAP